MKKYENGELPHHEQTQINQWIEQDACTKMYHKERVILYEFYSLLLFYILNNINGLIKGGDNMDKKLTDEQIQESAKELQREYMRLWRKKNRDKLKEYNERYWRKKALEMLKESKKKGI